MGVHSCGTLAFSFSYAAELLGNLRSMAREHIAEIILLSVFAAVTLYFYEHRSKIDAAVFRFSMPEDAHALAGQHHTTLTDSNNFVTRQ